MKEIVIIGGGSSGVLAAIFAKNKNNNVTILERNSTLLKKLLMTGNGKCNYFNDDQDLKNYHSQNKDILEKIITKTNTDMVINYFNNLGIVPKVKNGYYYPFSNQATTIKNVLENEINRLGINVIYNALVEDIKKEKDKFIIKYNDKVINCDNVVLAVGSRAYPKTGSDGCGYRFLKEFKHNIIKPLPALVQLECSFKYANIWAGVRSDVIVNLFEDDKLISSEEGEIQLTDYGVSGICIFNLSHYVTRGLDLDKKEELQINFVPFIKEDVAEWLKKHCKKLKVNLRNILEGILNYKLVEIILKRANLDGEYYFSDLSEWDIKTLAKTLSKFKLTVTGTKSFDFSQVCNGGVKLDEINPNTFESLKVKGLYITGELLDINGNCGGYNLTNCFISGIRAGEDISVKS